MNTFVLKLIAVITMVIDHSGVVFEFKFDVQNLRVIGRMAFPIFAFLIAEGCRHTKDIKKYALRLAFFAVLSELPFDMLFASVRNFPSTDIIYFNWSSQNIFWTLCLGVCAVWWATERQRILEAVDTTQFKAIAFLLHAAILVGIISLGALFSTDYGIVGITAIFLCYLVKKRPLQLLVLAGMVIYFYTLTSLYSGTWTFFNLKLTLGGLTSVACIAFYNGKKGPSAKWLFYLFYPLHVLVLLGIYEWALRLDL